MSSHTGLQPPRPQHPHRPDHLRLDPGV